MLPVVRGEAETTRQIVLYRVVLVAFTLVGRPLASARSTSVPRVVLGAVFLGLAWQLRRQPTRRHAGVLFHYSLLYLALLFVAAAVDPVIL